LLTFFKHFYNNKFFCGSLANVLPPTPAANEEQELPRQVQVSFTATQPIPTHHINPTQPVVANEEQELPQQVGDLMVK